jgi:hypothetical protein
MTKLAESQNRTKVKIQKCYASFTPELANASGKGFSSDILMPVKVS